MDRLTEIKKQLDFRSELENQIEALKQQIRDLKQQLTDKTIEKKVETVETVERRNCSCKLSDWRAKWTICEVAWQTKSE